VNKADGMLKSGDNRAAVLLYDRSIKIYDRLLKREGRKELSANLAHAFMNKGAAVSRLGDRRAAAPLYDRAIEIYERLVNHEGRKELAQNLAILYKNKKG
jgi:lipopolysaccharide biosynthesis regulator YciM